MDRIVEVVVVAAVVAVVVAALPGINCKETLIQFASNMV